MLSLINGKERRSHTRLDFCGRLFFQTATQANDCLPPNKGAAQKRKKPAARIKNIGSNGCGLILDRPLEKFLVLKIEFPLPQSGSSIPTLAEVRWVRSEQKSDRYFAGVRYLL